MNKTKLLQMVESLRRRPQTAKQLSISFGVKLRVIYRNIEYIKDAGLNVSKTEDRKYWIFSPR